MKKRIYFILIVAAIVLVVAGIKQFWADANIVPSKKVTSVNTSKVSNEDDKSVVFISISGKSKQILSRLSFPFHKGATPLNLLTLATKSKGIQLECRGAGSTAYVVGIANLYGMDYGPQSGWVFRVNGSIPSVGSGSYSLHPGDWVEWAYTCNSGKDAGAALR